MLNLDHIKKKYGQFCLDCSLNVKPGSITGLIGKNGAGKTTTFKVILGLFEPEEGEVCIFGKKLKDLSLEDRQKIGVVFCDSGFNNLLSPKDLIPILKNLYPSFDEESFSINIKTHGLPVNKKLKDFSTGMKAKLKMLVVLSLGAKLLILDEPTVGLDVIARKEILDLVRGFMEEDEERSILISSHNSKDLEMLCDDLYLIDDGQILLHEDTDRILSSYGLLKVSPEQFNQLDKNYLLRYKKEIFWYECLTDQKQYYYENYPDISIEPGSIDEVLTMMLTGETI